jgi:hypothetical protein
MGLHASQKELRFQGFQWAPFAHLLPKMGMKVCCSDWQNAGWFKTHHADSQEQQTWLI